ncbi:MAG: hypothetical protein HETSPECPRED_004550 [Heterodermia speciosa]|uniref:Uncharacterized protein n=1 Tax=Heterodermia speciosa TaxID=116794 RepID=A0A8H3FD68_9LECA|nr:MAG: hypothetical protein HETSPECPRED_004550 [Heterodermia speciosa]
MGGTFALELRFYEQDESLEAATRITRAELTYTLIRALANLSVNKQFRIDVESDQVSDGKAFENFAKEIGLLKGWAVSLTTETSISGKASFKNDEADEESDEEESDEEESDGKGADREPDQLLGVIGQSSSFQEQDSSGESIEDDSIKGEKHDDDEREIIDYDKEHDDCDIARYIWTWRLNPATTSSKKAVPTISRYRNLRRRAEIIQLVSEFV